MTDFNNDQLSEIHCLNLFDLNNTHVGLKVHHTAKPDRIEAMKRLFEKGLVTQEDGGYLTSLGQEAAELAQGLQSILRPVESVPSETDTADLKQTEIEAAVFRHFIGHLDQHKEVQNIDLMILASFCRNCLSKWYVSEAEKLGVTTTYDEARERVYGMPYEQWKTQYQTEATAEQMKAFKEKNS